RITPARIVCFAVVLAAAGGLGLWRWHGPQPRSVDAESTPDGGPAAVVPAGEGELRMIVGSTNSYVDRSGRGWGADRFFSGGSVVVRPSERVLRTLDPDIYRHVRTGEFRYDIPLSPGSYELHLHFAETGLADFISAESSGEGQRIFRVTANGARILDGFDV